MGYSGRAQLKLYCHVCVTSRWVGSNTLWLWMRDVHSVLPSAPQLSSYVLMLTASFIESIYFIVGSPLFLLPLFFSTLLSFLKNLAFSWYAWNRMTSVFVILTSSSVLGLISCRTLLFIFLGVQGVCRAVLQHHISHEHFFPYQPLHCLPFTSVQSNGDHGCGWSLP